ncbi:hypothetical protein VT84_14120 [Gemmata sp. SH-PL17]|nr:hypothetical protein VT84_14120 [Gemmata sp. SH-PL17]
MPVELTAKTTVSGRIYYAWEQRERNYTTSAFQAPVSPLRGTTTVNPAREVNNNDVPTGTIVFVRQAGSVGGQVYYEFQYETGGSGGGGACGSIVKVGTDDCIKATGPTDSVYLEYAAGQWTSTTELTYPGGSGVVVFWIADGRLRCTLDGNELVNCGDCFVGGPLTGHGTSTGACDGETFTVCLACACCSIDGWDGPGWYCVRAAGTDDACVPVELLDEDRCDTSIEICSGPYVDEAAAQAICGVELVPSQCSPNGFAANYFAITFTGVTNGTCTDCNNNNTTTLVGPYDDLNCRWFTFGNYNLCGSILSSPSFQIDVAVGTLRFLFVYGINTWTYSIPVGSWDWQSAVVLPLTSSPGGTPPCDTLPASVTLTPA